MPSVETQTETDFGAMLSEKPCVCSQCGHVWVSCSETSDHALLESSDEEDPDHGDDEDPEEDTASELSCTPLFDEDPEDVEEYIHKEIHAWLSFPSNLRRFSAANIESLIAADVLAVLMDEWVDSGICVESDRPDVADWVQAVVHEHLSYHVEVPPRQGGRPEPLTALRRAKLHNKLRQLDAAQRAAPAQRSPEWFLQRYNLLTASNAYKAFGSEAQKNSLIVEKCQSYDEFVAESAKRGGLGHGTAMGWGIKYEPLTAMLYERMNPGTTLGEYGCMVHPDWPFLGASPDGVNVEPASEKYGRMVEIKNIVNRDITGIPLEHYWIQMQIQMEVCDLDECDFVETRFKEFAGGKREYLLSTHEWKGVVLLFTPPALTDPVDVCKDKKAFYVHFICDQGEETDIQTSTDRWMQEQKDRYGAEGFVLSDTAYWYLDQYSCVLVKRNQEWFDAVVHELEEMWSIVQAERATGCDHRRPKRRGGGGGERASASRGKLLVDVNKLD